MPDQDVKKIFVYSSSSIVASSLALLFQQDARFFVLSGNNEDNLFNGIKNHSFEVIIIFENSVSVKVFDLVKRITESAAYDDSIKIIVIGTLERDIDLLTLIKLGVSGYFQSSMDTNDMIFYINNIAKGISFYSTRVMAPLIKRLVAENDELFSANVCASNDLLTKREMAILRDICKGLSVEEISADLYISNSTVKNHLSNIYRKMGVKNRTQALLTAIREGLYTPE